MLDLPGRIAISVDELQVDVLAARPFDLRFLDEHVATTLPAASDGITATTTLVLPQHQSRPRTQKCPHNHARTQERGRLPRVRCGKRGSKGGVIRGAGRR